MPTALVVDDAQLDRAMITGLLKKQADWRVETASDGGEALARLDQRSPPIDLVVTDLHMPGINGLELITALRLRSPGLPVVLITAKGSELLAMQALEQGAASYVPKSQLAERLAETVREVWSVVRSQSAQIRLVASMTRALLKFEIDGDESLFPALVELAQQHAANVGLCDAGGQIRLGMALNEALRTALYQGNLELSPAELQQSRRLGNEGLAAVRSAQSPFRERRLFVEMDFSGEAGRIEVVHEGQGIGQTFDDATGPISLEHAATRTLVLMRSLMDEARMEDGGRRLVLVKRKRTPEAATMSERTAR